MRKILLYVILACALVFMLGSGSVIAQDGSNETEGNVTDSNVTEVNVTGVNVTVSDMIGVALSRYKYLGNDSLEGSIRINLDGPVESDRKITVSFGDNATYMLSFDDALIAAGYNFTESAPVLEATDPGNAKEVYVESGSSSMFALRLPSGIEGITSIAMNIVGKPSNILLNPYMDVGNDGTFDWYYLGGFLSWNPGFLKSDDLEEGSEGKASITDNSTYYCELIDVPRTKDIRVSAKYRRVNSGGDIKAAVFSPIGGDPTWIGGSGNVCDLPEQAVSQYASCDISLDYAAKGRLHVCVYSQTAVDNSELYEVSMDGLGLTSSTYNCFPKTEFCNPQEDNNYFIKVQTADYSDNLNVAASLGDWNTYPGSFADGIEHFVGTEETEGVCFDPHCTIPVAIYGNGTGTVTLNGLDIRYRSQSTSKTESTIYLIDRANPEVTSINGFDLESEPFSVEIPLSAFGEFRTDVPAFLFIEQVFDVAFNQEKASAIVRVYRDEIPKSVVERKVDGTLGAINNALANADSAKLLELLDTGFADAVPALESYASGLASSPSVELEAEVEDFLAGLPAGIRLSKSFADQFIAEPDDVSVITSDLTDAELYSFQFNAEIGTFVKVYEIEYNSGDIEDAVLVTKRISPVGDAGKVSVYESIPKSFAQSVDDISFDKTPTKVVNPDPVVSWYFPKLQGVEISYAARPSGDFDIYDLKTLIAPAEAEEEEEVAESFCGDGFCDLDEDSDICPDDCVHEGGSNLWLVVGVFAAVVLLGLYGWVFMNPYNFRKAALGGMPFRRKDQLNSVLGYVASAKSKGMPDVKISEALKKNRWSGRQIKFALGAVDIDRKLDAKLRSVPPAGKSSKPMGEYLVAALGRGMDVKTVTNYLVKSGWKKGQVGNAYLMARLVLPFRLLLSKFGLK